MICYFGPAGVPSNQAENQNRSTLSSFQPRLPRKFRERSPACFLGSRAQFISCQQPRHESAQKRTPRGHGPKLNCVQGLCEHLLGGFHALYNLASLYSTKVSITHQTCVNHHPFLRFTHTGFSSHHNCSGNARVQP